MMITPRQRRLMAVACWLAFAFPTVPFAGSATGNWGQFAPLIFGNGSDEVVVFTAPSCPFCRQLIDHLPALAERYRVIVLPISFTSYDAQRVRALACAADQDAAARAFLLHQDIILPQQEPCDLNAIRARYADAQRRRITAVPFIVRSDDKVSQGLRPDFHAWLARGTKP